MGATGGALVAIAIGTIAFVLGIHNSTELTQIQHSACQVEPAGRECQDTKIESDKAASLATSCIQFRKVDLNGKLLADTRCKGGDLSSEPIVGGPGPHGHHSASPGRETPSPSRAAAAPEGGGANSSPVTGHSLPGRHEGGSSGGGSREVASGGGVHKESPEKLAPASSGGSAASAPAPTAPTSPSTSSSSTTERTSETTVEERAPTPPEAPAPVRSAVGGLVESVGGVVEETGSTVDGTVESVTGTTCELAKLLCQE
jgi:hypothetical protein